MPEPWTKTNGTWEPSQWPVDLRDRYDLHRADETLATEWVNTLTSERVVLINHGGWRTAGQGACFEIFHRDSVGNVRKISDSVIPEEQRELDSSEVGAGTYLQTQGFCRAMIDHHLGLTAREPTAGEDLRGYGI